MRSPIRMQAEVGDLVPFGDMDWAIAELTRMHELMISGWGERKTLTVARRDSQAVWARP